MFCADLVFLTRSSARVAACALSAVLIAGPASAGLIFDAPEGGYPELPVRPAPPFNPDKTISVDSQVGTTLSLSVDPATITSDSDGVVRYVSVSRARNGSGAINATYEGIRCTSAEVKVFARHFTDGDWRPVADPKWRPLTDGGSAVNSMAIAKAGVCQDAAPGGSAPAIVQNLRNGAAGGVYRVP